MSVCPNHPDLKNPRTPEACLGHFFLPMPLTPHDHKEKESGAEDRNTSQVREPKTWIPVTSLLQTCCVTLQSHPPTPNLASMSSWHLERSAHLKLKALSRALFLYLPAGCVLPSPPLCLQLFPSSSPRFHLETYQTLVPLEDSLSFLTGMHHLLGNGLRTFYKIPVRRWLLGGAHFPIDILSWRLHPRDIHHSGSTIGGARGYSSHLTEVPGLL